MSAANNSSEVATRSWDELPHDILSMIADRLGIIELLSFRGTCRDFRYVSSTASAQIESTQDPWLLTYREEDSRCSLHNVDKDGTTVRTYTLNVEELQGATCLASDMGWLLMFKRGSVFFFSPLSRAKIPLPDFPQEEAKDIAGSFSTSPTEDGCVVLIINGCGELNIELNVVHRGDTIWTTQKINRHPRLGAITGITYDDDSETFYCHGNMILTYSLNEEVSCAYHMIVMSGESLPMVRRLPYSSIRGFVRKKNVVKLLNLGPNTSLDIAGTRRETEEGFLECIHNETIYASMTSSSDQPRHLKGVWFHPRFFQVPGNQSWSF